MEELLKKVSDVVPALQGWCTVEKAQWLTRWIVENRCLNVVEIGVFGGRSLVPMAMAVDQLSKLGPAIAGKVTGIDAYKNDVAEVEDSDAANREWWKTVDMKAIFKAAQEAVISNRLGHIVDFMLLSSVDAAVLFADQSLDLVHVDGSHNEAASTRDVNLWWPKLRPGGVMVMDDTDWKQLQAARQLVGSMGKIIYHDEKWEAYQKV